MRPQLAVWMLRVIATGLAMTSLVFCLNQVLMQILRRDLERSLSAAGILANYDTLSTYLSSVTLILAFTMTCSISGCVLSLVALYPAQQDNRTQSNNMDSDGSPIHHRDPPVLNYTRPATPPPPYFLAIQLSADMQPSQSSSE
nr:small hydropobic protein [Avian metaavulavirus 6]